MDDVLTLIATLQSAPRIIIGLASLAGILNTL